MKKDLTYSQAFEELEKLVAEIEDDGIQLDVLATKVKEAKELISFCEKKLRVIEKDVTKGMSDE